MALEQVTTCEALSEAERYEAALIKGWDAIDPTTGAFLFSTSGRSSQPTKWILILPNKGPEDRGGLLAPYEWDYPKGRKTFRVWGLREAIEIGNRKLAKMVL